MSGRRVLVTGGSGFVGSHLVDSLLRDGWQVTVVDNFDPFYDPAAKERNIRAHRLHSAYSLVRRDIRNLDALRTELQGGYEVVVHLAAKAGVRPSIEDPVTYSQVNVLGTQNLLELAKEWGSTQFVFASSSSVYGVNPDVPWREDVGVLRPISPYASTKISGELLGHVYSHLYGIRFLALRLFTVYGPRQRPDLAIHKFVRLMRAHKPIPIFGDGSTRRDYTFIGDVVQGIRKAMAYSGSLYEVINIGNSRTVGLIEMAKTIQDVLGLAAQFEFLREQPGDVPQTYADLTKARALLGFEPSTAFKAGIGEFLKWYEQTKD